MIWTRRDKKRLARELEYLREDVERLRRDLYYQTYGSLDTFIPNLGPCRPWSQRVPRG